MDKRVDLAGNLMDWNDYERIARMLLLAEPGLNPLGLSDRAIVRMVTDLGLLASKEAPLDIQIGAIRKKWILLGAGAHEYTDADFHPACLDG
jgi:hypothetical protein